jgi:hypothetical protein
MMARREQREDFSANAAEAFLFELVGRNSGRVQTEQRAAHREHAVAGRQTVA